MSQKSKNKVFAEIAEIGKSTYGWFYGFKLHMAKGRNSSLTKSNVDDRKNLFLKLLDRNLKLVTKWGKKSLPFPILSLSANP